MKPGLGSRVRRLIGGGPRLPSWSTFRPGDVDGELGEVLATDPTRHVHLAQCVRDVESGLSRRNLWTLRGADGEPVGLLQAVRGVSWVLASRVSLEEGLDLVAERVRRRAARRAVLFGEDHEVEYVARRLEEDGRFRAERRPQWRMARLPGAAPGEAPRPEGFRRADEADVPWLLEAHGAMCREDLGRDLVATDPESYARYFRHLARLGRVFVVEREGHPVFKMEIPYSAGGAWLIEGVYTIPSARRRGIARAAVARVSTLIERAGGVPCLHVNRDNEGAIDLYRELGYEIRGPWLVAVARRG